MNRDILEKYNISFYITSYGAKAVDVKDRISSYLYVWSNLDDVDDLLSDIDLLLTGNYDFSDYISYSEPVLNIYADLTPDNLILTGPGGRHPLKIPLVDFKELLLAWREYLMA